jgi:hypothetical protein
VTDERVEIQFDENVSDTAVLLLAAAEELGLGPEAVKTAEGAFVVPKEVAEKAFAPAPEEKPRRAPKKAAAKKK